MSSKPLFYLPDNIEEEEDCLHFVIIDEFQEKFGAAVSLSVAKDLVFIEWNLHLYLNLKWYIFHFRWCTSRASVSSVLELTVWRCSNMEDCVGCRWSGLSEVFHLFSYSLTHPESRKWDLLLCILLEEHVPS